MTLLLLICSVFGIVGSVSYLLSNIQVRCCHFLCSPVQCSTQLLGFSDASEEAYAAVVYLRVQDADGSVHVSLVTSKTQLAQLKCQTIPHLELCGAVLLSQVHPSQWST